MFIRDHGFCVFCNKLLNQSESSTEKTKEVTSMGVGTALIQKLMEMD